MKNQESISKLQRAQNRLEKLKRFYNHLFVFLVINCLIIGFKVSNNLHSWDAFASDLFSFSTLSTPLIWGVVLAIHAFSVFVFPKLIGYDWEARKIEQFMNEEMQSKN